ncbi:MAG: copper amine oxidase N-terminal domain-containing protein [Bacillota bacterium]
MKKLISLAMVAAMTVSMVPSTAFAAVGSGNFSGQGISGQAVGIDPEFKGNLSFVAKTPAVRSKGIGDIGITGGYGNNENRWDPTYLHRGVSSQAASSGIFADGDDTKSYNSYDALEAGTMKKDSADDQSRQGSYYDTVVVGDTVVPEIQIKFGDLSQRISNEFVNSVIYFDVTLSGGGIAYATDDYMTIEVYENTGTALRAWDPAWNDDEKDAYYDSVLALSKKSVQIPKTAFQGYVANGGTDASNVLKEIKLALYNDDAVNYDYYYAEQYDGGDGVAGSTVAAETSHDQYEKVTTSDLLSPDFVGDTIKVPTANQMNTLLSYNPSKAPSNIWVSEIKSSGGSYFTNDGTTDALYSTAGYAVDGTIFPGDGQAGMNQTLATNEENAVNIFVEQSSIKTRLLRGAEVVTDFTVAVVYNNIKEANDAIKSGDILTIDVPTWFSSTSAGSSVWANVRCEEMYDFDADIELAYIVDGGFTASYYKTLDTIAPEERIRLSQDIDLTEIVAGSFEAGQEVTFKLSRGFEFSGLADSSLLVGLREDSSRFGSSLVYVDDEMHFTVTNDSNGLSRQTISVNGTSSTVSDTYGIGIEATTAKVGDIATITISIDGLDKQTIEVAEVVDYTVIMEVDTDKSVPVYYSGVNRNNAGLTVNHSHESLDVTIRETFPGAWDVSNGFTLDLPDGVHVVDEEGNEAGPSVGLETTINGVSAYTSYAENSGAGVDIKDVRYIVRDNAPVDTQGMTEIFKDAYVRGKYADFTFPRRPFDGENHTLSDAYAQITFSMFLTADPSFEGPVDLTFSCNGTEDQTVTIAEFVKPFTVTAQQNDMIIDYRNTALDTTIVLEEYEAELFDTRVPYLSGGVWNYYYNQFDYYVDRGDVIQFEEGSNFVIDGDSEMEVGGNVLTGDNLTDPSGIYYRINGSSYDVPATITIENIELFMQRSIPAGAYPLNMETTMWNRWKKDTSFGSGASSTNSTTEDPSLFLKPSATNHSEEVHSNFVNVITAGSDVDNAFLTSIIVPIDANYIIAGTKIISLEGDGITAATPPAYISNGYTMVPLRAVSEALNGDGIVVDWNNDTRTVSIIYPSKVINMTVGENVYSVYGNTVPTSAALEIKEGRAFLPFRDLGKMLGVTDSNISWDETNRVAIINGSVADIERIYAELGL